MGTKIKLSQEQHDLQGEMLENTFSWYHLLIQRKLARFQAIMKKINSSNEMEESWFEEADTIRKEMDHLQHKAQWEEKEIEKFNERCKQFEIKQQKDFMSNLSKKLSAKLNHKQ